MITTIHYNGGKLPEERITPYAEICTVFLGRRQQARGVELVLTPEQMQLILEPLACYMMVKGIRIITFDQAQWVIQEPLSRISALITPKVFLYLVENTGSLV